MGPVTSTREQKSTPTSAAASASRSAPREPFQRYTALAPATRKKPRNAIQAEETWK